MKTNLILGLSLVTLMLGSANADAVLLRLSQEEMVEASSEVVRGRITSLKSEWTPDRKSIVTQVTLRVTEGWTGKLGAGADVVLTVDGGTIGGITVFVEHEPVFWDGEDVVLFLQPDKRGRLRVTGAEQGKLTVAGTLVVGLDHRPRPFESFRNQVQETIREVKP